MYGLQALLILFLVALASPVLLFAVAFSSSCDEPADGFRDATDTELIAVFRAKRTEFERLRELCLLDRELGSIGTDNVDRWWREGSEWRHSSTGRYVASRAAMLAATGLSVERDAEYRRLFASVGAYRVVHRRGEAGAGFEVEVCMTRRGMVVHGSTKSLLYVSGAVEPRGHGPANGDELRFTPLGDGWYLKYEDT